MGKLISKEVSNLDNMIRSYIARDHDFRNMFNMTQFYVMMFLIKNFDKDICQKDIEKETNLKKASITGVIDSLAEKGFVERTVAEDDRRKNYIKLTRKAFRFKDMIENNVREVDEIMTKGVSKKELENFFTVIDKIRKNIEDRD